MGIDEQLVGQIVQRILGVTRPDRIILFGSAASGRMTRDSDIDVLVVTSSMANVAQVRARIDECLAGLGFPFDVFMIGAERFEDSKDVFGGIAYPAHKYGRVIYEAA